MNNYSKLCDLWYVTGFTIHQKICVKQTVFAFQILDAFIKNDTWFSKNSFSIQFLKIFVH